MFSKPLLSLLFCLVFCPQTHAWPVSFQALVAAEQQKACPSLALGELYNPYTMDVGVRQARFDKLYGPGTFSTDPEFKSFLSYLDFVSGERRKLDIFAAIRSIQGSATAAIRELEITEAQVTLVSEYVETLKLKIPKMTDTFSELQAFSKDLFKDWIAEKKKIQRIADLPSDSSDEIRQKEIEAQILRTQGDLTKLRGFYTEMQLSLRVANVEKTGFYLKDFLPPMKKMSEKVDYLLSPEFGMQDLVESLDSKLAPVDASDPTDTPLRAKARFLLSKEMDLEARTGPNSVTWFEPKNYDATFTSRDYHSPKGKSLQKQVKVSLLLRKIVMRLHPELQIRFELHFLNGIEAHPKRRFEDLFKELGAENWGVVGLVEGDNTN